VRPGPTRAEYCRGTARAVARESYGAAAAAAASNSHKHSGKRMRRVRVLLRLLLLAQGGGLS
jgi:hypothetical protein